VINTSSLGTGAATTQQVAFQADGFEPGYETTAISLVKH
jgi:hypothetical protein